MSVGRRGGGDPVYVRGYDHKDTGGHEVEVVIVMFVPIFMVTG